MRILDLSGFAIGAALLTVVALAAAGCTPPDPRIEPLPDADRPSAEERLGLPLLPGEWYAAGVEGVDEEAAEALLAFPLQIRVDTQRMDSIGGRIRIGEATARWFGEVRRNGRFSFIVPSGELAGRFAAGRTNGDTLWLEMGTLLDPERWSSPPRWALLRERPERRFARTREGRTIREVLPEDTIEAIPDTIPEDPERVEELRDPRPAEPRPAEPAPRPREEPRPPPEPAPEPEPAPVPEPEPEPEPTPPPREPPPLLGVPVEPEPEPPPPGG